MPKSKHPTLGYSLALFVILTLWVLANSGQFAELWGISQLTFLPAWWTYLTAVVVLLTAIPAVGQKLVNLMGYFSEWINKSSGRHLTILTIMALVFLLLAIPFVQSIPLLGDGSLRANEISNGKMWQPTEMLDFFIHALLYQHVFSSLGYSAATCYRVISIAFGIAFLLNVWVLARKLGTRNMIIYFLMLATSGMVVLFFGYIESYSMVAAFLPILIYLQIRVIKEEMHWFWAVASCLIGSLIHSIVFLLFAAPTLYTTLLSVKTELTSVRLANRIIAASVIIGIVSAYFATFSENKLLSGLLLPLTTGDSGGQALLSWGHALNILNWLYFLALPFWLLLPASIQGPLNPDFVSEKLKGYAVWLAVSGILFIVFFQPKIGGPRDWDLFSLAAFCLIPAIILIHQLKGNGRTPAQIIPILAISGSLVLAQAVINSSPRLSVQRFTQVIEVTKFRNLYLEYATLFKYADNYPEIADKKEEFGLMAWNQPPRTKLDSSYLSQSMALFYLAKSDVKKAASWAGRALKVDSLDLNAYKIVIQVYEKSNDKQRLLSLANLLELRYPSNAEALIQAGLIYVKQNLLQQGGALLKKAYTLDTSNFLAVINLGTIYIFEEQFDSASVQFDRAMIMDSSSFAAAIGLANAKFYLGQIEGSRQALQAAERLAKSADEKQRISYLRRYLGN